MLTVLRTSVYAAALAVTSAAAAQDQPPPSDTPQILVEGRKNLDKDIRDFVVARLRRVAEAADMPVEDAGCRPNVVVVVTPDKTAFLQALRKKLPNYFSGLPKSEVRRLLATPGPAVAWQLPGEPLDENGRPLASDSNNEPPISNPVQATRLTPMFRLQFSAAVVVVETAALEGVTTTQFADYAAMRAFISTQPARLGATTAPTILTMLDPARTSRVPATLTRWDVSLLRGLYRSDRAVFAGAQRNEMRKEVGRLLTDAGEK